MGQAIARLNTKYLTGEDRFNEQESKGMLHDLSTTDENDFNVTNQNIDNCKVEGDEVLVTPPKNLAEVKLKCDPRSPSTFDRTPLKLAKEEKVDAGDSF